MLPIRIWENKTDSWLLTHPSTCPGFSSLSRHSVSYHISPLTNEPKGLNDKSLQCPWYVPLPTAFGGTLGVRSGAFLPELSLHCPTYERGPALPLSELLALCEVTSHTAWYIGIMQQKFISFVPCSSSTDGPQPKSYCVQDCRGRVRLWAGTSKCLWMPLPLQCGLLVETVEF